jgi:hypothetical protein
MVWHSIWNLQIDKLDWCVLYLEVILSNVDLMNKIKWTWTLTFLAITLLLLLLLILFLLLLLIIRSSSRSLTPVNSAQMSITILSGQKSTRSQTYSLRLIYWALMLHKSSERMEFAAICITCTGPTFCMYNAAVDTWFSFKFNPERGYFVRFSSLLLLFSHT